MNWYLAKLIFDVQHDAATGTPQVAGQWRLIRADELAWAYEKAFMLGRLEASGRLSQTQAVAPGRFIGVADIIHLGAYNDGEPISNLIEESAQPDSYIQSESRHLYESLPQTGYIAHVGKIAAR
jgi:hypothetical protein